MTVPKFPPLWVKPAASLAAPNEDIPVNKFCASAFPDYEGELVIVTSKTCRDLSPDEASQYILGYTIGNDLTCRFHQIPQHGGGQFMFSKGFDKFAPIGPVLVSPEIYGNGSEVELKTRVNGEVRQRIKIADGMIWNPAQIISHMSQGKGPKAFF